MAENPPSPAKSQAETAKSRNRVLLVEDHPVFLHGLIDLIEAAGDFEVCGKAPSATVALSLMRKEKPDAVVVDIALPGTNGVELIKMMKAEIPSLAVLVVSMYDESQYALRALRAGALGYIMKGEATSDVVTGLRRILQGEIHLSPAFSERLIFKSIGQHETPESSPVAKLTPREIDVLELMGRGFGTREIGEQLNLSGKTVETHRGHMREKLHFKDTSELVRFAMEWVTRNEEAV